MLQALLVLFVLRQHLPDFEVPRLVVLVFDHVVLPLELLQSHILEELIQLVFVHFQDSLLEGITFRYQVPPTCRLGR